MSGKMNSSKALSESSGLAPLAILGNKLTGEKVASQLVASLMRQTRLELDDTEVVPDRRLTLNVGGVRFETWSSTLERVPGTRLALLSRMGDQDDSYDKSTGEFFFDRSPHAFECVLNYYRTEELHIDHNLCGNVLQKEFQFWGIEEMDIEPCCWADYSRFTEHKQTLRELDDTFAFVETELWPETSRWKTFADRIWLFLEDPSSSRWAKAYAIISMFFVALSILTFVLETHKWFQVDSQGRSMYKVDPDPPSTASGVTVCCCDGSYTNSTTSIEPETHPVLRAIDYACLVFFILEFMFRIIFAPNKKTFMKSPLNIIDLVCIIPHLISICLKAAKITRAASLLKTVMMLRVIRVLRIFKLMKHYGAFKILAYTIKVSTKELMLMVAFLMSGVLMFASIIHYAEKQNFPNIPIGIWWAIVTMTTVGYGDKYPVGYAGYMVGCLCVICGVLVIAFTVPIVVNNFSLYYSHAQTRVKLPKTRKHMVRKKLLGALNKNKPHGKKIYTKVAPYSLLTPRSETSTPRSELSPSVDLTPRPELTPEIKEMNVKNLNDLNTAATTTGRNIQTTPHGLDTRTITPVENSQTDKYAAESQQILENMAGADKKMEDERRRQEMLIRQKREQRAKERQGHQ